MDAEKLIIELATRLIEVAEVIKNRDPLDAMLAAEKRLEAAWTRIEIAS